MLTAYERFSALASQTTPIETGHHRRRGVIVAVRVRRPGSEYLAHRSCRCERPSTTVARSVRCVVDRGPLGQGPSPVEDPSAQLTVPVTLSSLKGSLQRMVSSWRAPTATRQVRTANNDLWKVILEVRHIHVDCCSRIVRSHLHDLHAGSARRWSELAHRARKRSVVHQLLVEVVVSRELARECYVSSDEPASLLCV